LGKTLSKNICYAIKATTEIVYHNLERKSSKKEKKKIPNRLKILIKRLKWGKILDIIGKENIPL